MGSENLGKTCGGGPNPLGHCESGSPKKVGKVPKFGENVVFIGLL
mgnify:CR=1 FL=1